MVRKYLFFVCIGILIQGAALGQQIRNIQAVQEGQSIRISYTLESEYNCNVSAFVSTDNGASWAPLFTVEGDIGLKVKPGDNSFLWRVIQDRENLVGESIKFRVLANEIITKVIDVSDYSKYTANYSETKMFRNNGITNYYGVNSIPNAIYQQKGANLETSAVQVFGSGLNNNYPPSNLQTSAYIDGIPVTNAFTGSAIEWVDPMLVDEISVSSQVNSPEYGAGLGNINIKLAKPETEGLAFSTTNSIASFGAVKTMNQVVVGDSRNFIVATSNFTQDRGYLENDFGKKNQYSLHGRFGNSKVRHSFFVNNNLFRGEAVNLQSLNGFIANPQEVISIGTERFERFVGGYGMNAKLASDVNINVGISFNRFANGVYSSIDEFNIQQEYRAFVHRLVISKKIKISSLETMLITAGEEGQLNKQRDGNFVDILQNAQVVSGAIKDSYLSATQFNPFAKIQVDSKRFNRAGAFVAMGNQINAWQSMYENDVAQSVALYELKTSSALNTKLGAYFFLNGSMQLNGQMSWGYLQPMSFPGDIVQIGQGYVFHNLSRQEVGLKGTWSGNFSYDLTFFKAKHKVYFSDLVSLLDEEEDVATSGGMEFGMKYKFLNQTGAEWTLFARGNLGNLTIVDSSNGQELQGTGMPKNKLFVGAQFDSDHLSFGMYDYWRSTIFLSGDGTQWIQGGHELNTFLSIHSNPNGADAYISLDLGINNALSTQLPLWIRSYPNAGFVSSAPALNAYANVRFRANLSDKNKNSSMGGRDYNWRDLSNFYFEYRNFTGNSNMNAAYGIGMQAHVRRENSPIGSSFRYFTGVATNNTEFYTRLFEIPDGEISSNGAAFALLACQNVELMLVSGDTKLTVGVGGSLNIYTTDEPDTYDYSYGYLFVDKLFLVSPGIDLSANLYINSSVTIGLTYSKCAKITLANDDSDTPNYLYSEEVDLSNWALRFGFNFN